MIFQVLLGLAFGLLCVFFIGVSEIAVNYETLSVFIPVILVALFFNFTTVITGLVFILVDTLPFGFIFELEGTHYACIVSIVLIVLIVILLRVFVFKKAQHPIAFPFMMSLFAGALFWVICAAFTARDVQINELNFITNSVSTIVGSILIKNINGNLLFRKFKLQNIPINNLFFSALSVVMVVDLIVMTIGTYNFVLNNGKDNMVYASQEIFPQYDSHIDQIIDMDINNTSLNMMVDVDRYMSTGLGTNENIAHLRDVAYDGFEIYVVNKNGMILTTSDKDKTNCSVYDYPQISEVFNKTNRANSYSSKVANKYFYEVGFACVIDTESDVLVAISEQYRPSYYATTNITDYLNDRSMSERTSFVVLCNSDWVPLSNWENNRALSDTECKMISELLGDNTKDENTLNESTFEDEKVFYIKQSLSGYYNIALFQTETSLIQTAQESTTPIAVVEILVFGILLILVFLICNEVVIKNTGRMNDSIKRITNGNINEKVNIKNAKEFYELSEGINDMVYSLKTLMNEQFAVFSKELSLGKKIQSSTLPVANLESETKKNLDLGTLIDPAGELCGDFYDFYELGENKFIFMIADVAGKGLSAAMFMMLSKAVFRSFAVDPQYNLEQVFNATNEQLVQDNNAKMFLTAWMGVFNKETNEISFVNAGHNLPLLKKNGGSFEYLQAEKNMVVAWNDKIKYKHCDIEFQQGDTIFLYTDGVTEARNNKRQFYGEERLKNILNSIDTNTTNANEICKIVREDVKKFTNGAEQNDDITMLCLKCNIESVEGSNE